MFIQKTICITTLCLALGGASLPVSHAAGNTAPSEEIKLDLINSKGAVIGKASLQEQADGVHIRLAVEQLAPGMHGIHFHETGKCEAPEFTTAGAHFNPLSKQHGFSNPKGFHSGDLPNIQVDASGKVEAEIISKNVTLAKGVPNSLIKSGGAALVIHEKADDYVTDPSGNSGARIACGVIK
ncbi:superoxide dismutase family protein [Paenibacillus algorifonticola]|uniref:superoxide dismutase family protein n=1 Tax=Paenibacillus algorifonticola TaxID=684063 RepID=UPI003D2DCDC1